MANKAIENNIMYWCADHKDIQGVEVDFAGFGIEVSMALGTHTLIKRIAYEHIEITNLATIFDSMYDMLTKLPLTEAEMI